MLTEDIFALGLGLHSPWKLKGQQFDIEKHPNELHIIIGAERGHSILAQNAMRCARPMIFWT